MRVFLIYLMKKADNMDKLYLEVPTIARKNEAYEFIQKFFDNNSSINGSGSLPRYVNKEKIIMRMVRKIRRRLLRI